MTDAPGHIEFVHRSWPADPGQLAVIRHQLAGWLAPLRLTEAEIADVVLAVDEAAANAVCHAYGTVDSAGGVSTGGVSAGGAGKRGVATDGVVELTLWTEPGTLCIEIVDHGSWQPPAEYPANGGRGISLMSRMSESVLIHHDQRGSRVLLRHRVPGVDGS